MTAELRPGATPTIVFVSQLGTGGDSWQPVIDRLTCGAATFTYDRPGTGNAAPRPAPNPALSYGVFADELRDLLEREDVGANVVVVGHSFGSLIARMFATRYPGWVSGLVHVDGSMPQFHAIPSGEAKHDGDGPGATEIDVVSGQAEILTEPIPEVPTLVLARTHGRWDGKHGAPHPAVEDLWRIHQRRLAAEAKSPLIVADDAGHQLPRDAPGLVAYAVDEVYRAARTDTATLVDTVALGRAGGHLY